MPGHIELKVGTRNNHPALTSYLAKVIINMPATCLSDGWFNLISQTTTRYKYIFKVHCGGKLRGPVNITYGHYVLSTICKTATLGCHSTFA